MATFIGTSGDDVADSRGNPSLEGFTGGSTAALVDTIGDEFLLFGGNDVVYAGDGNDTISVTGGQDRANGGGGDDLLIVDYSAITQDLIRSGVFFLINSSATTSVQVGTIERFIVKTGSGNDKITTAAGRDTVSAGAGNDSIDTRAGDASVDGGGGSDTWHADLSAETASIRIDLLASGINAIGGGNFAGNVEALNKLTTGSGNDRILTRIGNPLDGFNDFVVTSAGNDTIRVGGGSDIVNGGAGDDVLNIDYSTSTDNLIRAGVYFLANTGATTAVQVGGIERFNVKTGSGNDLISVQAGNDTVASGAGDDNITANAGNDVINGASGSDTILGGDGNDRIIGGAQKDSLTGGLGLDTFDFNRTQESGAGLASRDVIAGFDANAQDKIDLSTIDANADGGTADDAFAFIDTGPITGLGQIRYRQFDLAGTVDDYTLVEVNTTGTNVADMRIELRGLITLDAADFVL